MCVCVCMKIISRKDCREEIEVRYPRHKRLRARNLVRGVKYYIPCLRLLTPSAGRGEGALSLVEDMVGEEPSTSFPVQTNHCPALFCGSVMKGGGKTLKACCSEK